MNRNRTLRLTLAAILVAVAVVGSLFSFPVFGSKCSPVQHMVNVVCGLVWKYTKKLLPTLAGEVFGTGVIGGLLAYPIAIAFMGVSSANVAFYAYVVPFLISTVVGSIIAGAIIFALQKNGTLNTISGKLN